MQVNEFSKLSHWARKLATSEFMQVDFYHTKQWLQKLIKNKTVSIVSEKKMSFTE